MRARLRDPRLPAPGTPRRRSTASCSTADDRHRRRIALTRRARHRVPARPAAGDCAARRRRARARRRRRSCASPASPSRCVEITARDAARAGAARLASRQPPPAELQIVGDRLRIRHDHVLEDMLRGLGAHVDADRGAVRPRRRRLRRHACTPASSRGTAHDHDQRHARDHPTGTARPLYRLHGLAVAGLSGRRLLLFAAGSNGRSRRARCHDATSLCALARP